MSRKSWRAVVALLGCASVAGLLAGSSAGALSARVVRLGLAPRHPAGSVVVGSLPSSTPMRITVELRPRDPAALTAFATAVSTPGSSTYRQFLSVPEFRARFGPTDAQIADVESDLRAQGLSPGPVSANGLAIPVVSTVGQISQAFSVSLQQVHLHSGRVALANEQAPRLPASIAGYVQDVIGLNNLFVPQSDGVKAAPAGFRNDARGHVAASPAGFRNDVRRRDEPVTGGPQPCSTAVADAPGNSSLTANQIAYSYQASGLYAQGDEGQGQTIAVYELGPYTPADITAYESCYGISTPVTNVPIDGGSTGGESQEAILDIDDIIGLAPKANVEVYSGPNDTDQDTMDSSPWDTYNAIMSADTAKVISTSWGGCEPIEGTTAQEDENPLFEEAAAQGQAIFAYAGDYGSTSCAYNADDSLEATDPASQPFVTGVGGTSLTPGLPPTESVWNDECGGGACGGGGGMSDLWTMQAYQSDTPRSLNVINSFSSGGPCGTTTTLCRETPDVSADADPDNDSGYEIHFGGTWIGYGGTSGAAPTWAALTALINASSGCHGVPIGFANPALYGAASNAYAADFNDITVGSNAIADYGQTTDYPATAGYDMASGLGTPKTTALASTLCDPPVTVSNPGTETTNAGTGVGLQITAHDGDGLALRDSASGLPSGLSINSSGRISGTARAGGLYRTTVTATDSRNSAGSTTFYWIVIGKPKPSSGAFTGIAQGKPKLAFTLSDGSGIKKIVITLPKGLKFNHGAKLKRGIKLTSGGRRLKHLKFKLSGGKLTITLSSSKTSVRIKIVSPAIKAGSSLIKKAKHRRFKLQVTLKATDALGHVTKLKFKLKAS